MHPTLGPQDKHFASRHLYVSKSTPQSVAEAKTEQCRQGRVEGDKFCWGQEEFTEEVKLVYNFEGQRGILHWDCNGTGQRRKFPFRGNRPAPK